jgi:ABC-type Fe3+/spermidine/putrescine transport system ATPase subunit
MAMAPAATTASTPILRLERLNKRFGAAQAAHDLSLEVHAGEFFTFLGPSGSGKSSILRMVAGLERPDSGRIVIAGRDVSDVPPWQRNLGMVFQSYAVFPHMTVVENVGYGPRMKRRPKQDIAATVERLLALVGLAGFGGRSVTTLSGGEQQRVALARALAMKPALLLLDEPLSALDEKIRREMQIELKRIQKTTETTFLYVTHDQEEALTMSDRIAVINRGKAVQCDAPEALFRRPRTRFVAEFFRGCNVLEAECVALAGATARIVVAGVEAEIALGDRRWPGSGRVAVALRSEAPLLGAEADRTAIRLDVGVTDVVYRGTNVDHLLRLPDGQPLLVTATRRQAKRGARVPLGFDAKDLVPLEA